MSQAQLGSTVKVHYTGKLSDGTVFDTSSNRDPLEFQLGAGQVIPGFEKAIVGMAPGETKNTTIPAEEAYGPHRQEMVVEIEKEQIPPDLNPQVGQQLQLRQPNGQAIPATVTEIGDANVKLDANHPLAGKDLMFEVELVEVQ